MTYDPFNNFDLFFVGGTPYKCTPRDDTILSLKPRMDLYEDAEANTVTATFELAGFNKEEIEIEVDDGKMRVSAENKISDDRKDSGYVVRERRYGKFSRTVRLPRDVKAEEIKASMEDGILTVTFPLSVPGSPRKRVQIS